MEFKEKLKALRLKKKLSQQALADTIYVSRSAVAKWENGLGLPSEESLEALASFFGVAAEALRSDDPEQIILQKNKRLHRISVLLSSVAIFLLFAFSFLICASVISPKYGITWEDAAGVYADNPYIEAGDYRIYYYSISYKYNGEAREEYKRIDGFKIIKKAFIGYKFFDETDCTRKVYIEGVASGRLISIEGNGCYYNILKISVNRFPLDLLSFDAITVDGVEHGARLNSYFITKEKPSKALAVGNTVLTIEDTAK